MPALNKRLICAADMLDKGCVTADIGTDHAFLPIYLINNGICPKVIASDIAKGPLDSAKINIEKRQMQDKIELRLAAGLDGIKPEECNAVTITGMGGETISDIINAAPWLKDGKHTLVLQPMTCDDRLRNYLDNNGFLIEKENAVLSQCRIYTVMRAVYTGKKPENDISFNYIGRLKDNSDELSKTLIFKKLKSLELCAKELENVPRKKEKHSEVIRVIAKIKANIQ